MAMVAKIEIVVPLGPGAHRERMEAILKALGEAEDMLLASLKGAALVDLTIVNVRSKGELS